MSDPKPRTAASPLPRRRVTLIGSVGLLALAASVAVSVGGAGWSQSDKAGPTGGSVSAPRILVMISLGAIPFFNKSIP